MSQDWNQFVAGELSRLESLDRRRSLRTILARESPLVEFQGRRLVNFSSNDYLGLSQHPAVKEGSTRAIARAGASASSSRLICGNSDLHEGLEAALADLKGKEAALTFASGFSANLGLLSSLAGPADHIFSDALNHGSIVDGCRLSRAATVVFRHNDLGHLEELLKDCSSRGRRLVVSDSVFSMEGDLADLPGLISLCRRYDCRLMLDEAHATGVLGSRGGGLVEYFQERGAARPEEIELLMGTLSKALGSFGGFVACSASMRDYLINKCRPFVFATALPPAVLGAALAGLELIRPPSEVRDRLWSNLSLMRSRLAQQGLGCGQGRTSIFPVLLGSEERALQVSRLLLDRGFLVAAIRPPSVPPGTSRLRITVTASHSAAQIDELVGCLTEIGCRARS
ncbi:MAG: 8-amino-7-oxononanoate synthase [Acidobacteria bacterium]|nr:8-amino-7-oxononanoate synthase [Acidobacteriota bacterium]